MLARLCTFIATFGPIGYSQAPGAVTAILTVPIMFWVRGLYPDDMHYGAVIAILIFLSFFIIKCALKTEVKGTDNPSEIVLDDFLGCFITFWSIPLSGKSMIIGLVVYRFVDLLKVAHLHNVNKQSSVWAVMIDDIVTAALANIILQFLF